MAELARPSLWEPRLSNRPGLPRIMAHLRRAGHASGASVRPHPCRLNRSQYHTMQICYSSTPAGLESRHLFVIDELNEI